MRVAVTGTRGIPGVQGGVESHCQALYSRLARMTDCHVTVFTRTQYIPPEHRSASWQGVSLVHMNCVRSTSLEAILHTLGSVWRARRMNPDILHIHAIGPALAVPLARCLGMTVVMTHHGPDYNRAKWNAAARIALRIGEYLGARFSHGVIAVSKGIRTMLHKKYNINAEFIPNGVEILAPVPPGETLRRYGLTSGQYIFTACRFVPEKRLDDLIRAFVKSGLNGVRLVIAGDADHDSEYSRSLKRLAACSEGIVLPGFVTGSPMAELMSNAGLFVLASSHEGLPIALLEAVGYGIPALVSDIQPNREVGLNPDRYFPCGDIGQLAARMSALFGQRLTEAEKAHYSELITSVYSWDRIADCTAALYRRILAGLERDSG